MGEWQSDREKTMESFSFQGQSLTPGQKARISALFGQLRYQVTKTYFQVLEGERRLQVRYVIASETESTITVRFEPNAKMLDLTLHRVEQDLLFIKSGKNLEYFRRAAA